MNRLHYYVDEHADEVVPCDCTLDGWARWLAADDPDWPHEIPADGDLIGLSTIEELGVVTARVVGGKWEIIGTVPEGATGFVARAGRTGWDAETWSETPLDCVRDGFLASLAEGDEDEIVCTRYGPNLMARFDAAGPALVIEGPQQ